MVDESEFFGLREESSLQRNDYARAVSEKAEVLKINRELYDSIVKKTQISESEKKIEFLVRYVPRFRSVARKLIEEMEVFFIKQTATQGYQILKQDE